MTDCRLRSDSDLRQHTQQCRAAPRRKSKQTQPGPMSSTTSPNSLKTVIFVSRVCILSFQKKWIKNSGLIVKKELKSHSKKRSYLLGTVWHRFLVSQWDQKLEASCIWCSNCWCHLKPTCSNRKLWCFHLTEFETRLVMAKYQKGRWKRKYEFMYFWIVTALKININFERIVQGHSL